MQWQWKQQKLPTIFGLWWQKWIKDITKDHKVNNEEKGSQKQIRLCKYWPEKQRDSRWDKKSKEHHPTLPDHIPVTKIKKMILFLPVNFLFLYSTYGRLIKKLIDN